MNMRQQLLVGTTLMLLASSLAWGGGVAAPEIDAASGTGAIALLTGVLLLVGEISRSRRAKKKP